MSFCEKCGSSLDDEVFFCPECGSSVKSKMSHVDEIAQIKKENKLKVNSHSSQPIFVQKQMKTSGLSPARYYGLFLLGGFMIIIGISILVGDLPSLPTMPRMPSIPPMPEFSGSIFLSIGLTVLALATVYLVGRESSRDPIIYWTIAMFIFTLGLSITISGAADIILPIGLTITGLLIVYLYSRHSTHPQGYYIVFAIAIIMIGISLIIPSSIDIIFPIGFIGGGLAICYSVFKSPLRPTNAAN
ncbi:MAG: zinc ribbon domain-containing protein [Candidatus Heimdallarchaeota archaeon]|nr:zinc ribbon domain-containing protein [Candidatus Heimdallarchaeota archaeon]